MFTDCRIYLLSRDIEHGRTDGGGPSPAVSGGARVSDRRDAVMAKQRKRPEETDLDHLKHLAGVFLELDIVPTKLSPVVVKHPFTDSGVGRDTGQGRRTVDGESVG